VANHLAASAATNAYSGKANWALAAKGQTTLFNLN